MNKCFWLTGLPSSGKTTIAGIVKQRYPDIEILNGDVFRELIGGDLGFSWKDRILNNSRIAFVASKIIKWGGDVLVAAVSPYREGRELARKAVEKYGRFYEVYVHASQETCISRDPKNLWAKAQKGEILGFTGWDDPYEEPLFPDIVLLTDHSSASECADNICLQLVKKPTQLFIGRWQPFHGGHEYIVRKALEDGPVSIGVRDTEIDNKNPHSVMDRIVRIRSTFVGEDVYVFKVPDINSVNVGRDPGYSIFHYSVPSDIASISATDIRRETNDK